MHTEESRKEMQIIEMPPGEPSAAKSKTELLAEMVQDLNSESTENSHTEEEHQKLEGFHRWLAHLSAGAQQGASLTVLLTYKDWHIEG
eukprot:1686673-Amphidinium_carterae.1